MSVSFEEVLEAARRCGGYFRDFAPCEVQDYILDDRPDILAYYQDERSFRMTVENKIEGAATNRANGKPRFYFDGLEFGWYRVRLDAFASPSQIKSHTPAI